MYHPSLFQHIFHGPQMISLQDHHITPLSLLKHIFYSLLSSLNKLPCRCNMKLTLALISTMAAAAFAAPVPGKDLHYLSAYENSPVLARGGHQIVSSAARHVKV
jgi:hypothetical protein